MSFAGKSNFKIRPIPKIDTLGNKRQTGVRKTVYAAVLWREEPGLRGLDEEFRESEDCAGNWKDGMCSVWSWSEWY